MRFFGLLPSLLLLDVERFAVASQGSQDRVERRRDDTKEQRIRELRARKRGNRAATLDDEGAVKTKESDEEFFPVDLEKRIIGGQDASPDDYPFYIHVASGQLWYVLNHCTKECRHKRRTILTF